MGVVGNIHHRTADKDKTPPIEPDRPVATKGVYLFHLFSYGAEIASKTVITRQLER